MYSANQHTGTSVRLFPMSRTMADLSAAIVRNQKTFGADAGRFEVFKHRRFHGVYELKAGKLVKCRKVLCLSLPEPDMSCGKSEAVAKMAEENGWPLVTI